MFHFPITMHPTVGRLLNVFIKPRRMAVLHHHTAMRVLTETELWNLPKSMLAHNLSSLLAVLRVFTSGFIWNNCGRPEITTAF